MKNKHEEIMNLLGLIGFTLSLAAAMVCLIEIQDPALKTAGVVGSAVASGLFLYLRPGKTVAVVAKEIHRFMLITYTNSSKYRYVCVSNQNTQAIRVANTKIKDELDIDMEDIFCNSLYLYPDMLVKLMHLGFDFERLGLHPYEIEPEYILQIEPEWIIHFWIHLLEYVSPGLIIDLESFSAVDTVRLRKDNHERLI